MPFSAYDRDRKKCAQNDRGGWWYDNCAHANLNGEYITPGTRHIRNHGEAGMIYRNFQEDISLKATKMMFRRDR